MQHSLPFSRPLHGLYRFRSSIPAVNCWATIIRPLADYRVGVNTSYFEAQVLSVTFLSVIVTLVVGDVVCAVASPALVQVSSLANTRRSGALCVSTITQPFRAILPVPVKLVPPEGARGVPPG